MFPLVRKWPVRTLALSLLSLVPSSVCAQFYTTGADPLGVRWTQLPGGGAIHPWRIMADSCAWRWSLLADDVLSRQADSLAADFPQLSLRRRDIRVVVHSRHAYSNGLVTWAPRRLEAYSFNTGADDCVPWVRHLLTHEYRHVLQSQSSITGFSRFLYGLFGEQSTGLVLGLFVPRWYLEGDAVWAETRYTDGGRGRNPDFVQQMRALCLSGRTPSFCQAYFGSYATRVPDFYSMGYIMVDETSKSFGNEVLGRAVSKAGRLPFTFFPFQRSLRRQTGMRPMTLYRFSMERRAAQWQAEMNVRKPTEAVSLLRPVKPYQEALYFTPWDGGFVTYVSSPEFVAHFDVYDSGMNLLRSITPSAREETRFAVSGNKMVWSERRQHGRWANASESCLMMADLSTWRVRRLTRGGDFHSPALRRDGDSLACVSVGRDMSHGVDLISGGSARRVITLPVGWQIPEVIWQDAHRLLLIVVNDDGRQVVSLNLDTGDAKLVFGPCHSMIKDISLGSGAEPRLFFTMNADSACVSDVFSLGLGGGDLRREVVAQYGAACPAALGDSLVVSIYEPDGYAPSVVRALEHSDFGNVGEGHDFLIAPDSAKFAGFSRLGPIAAQLRPNVHSWGPILVDADNQAVKPGVGVASQNVLGSVYWQAGYSFAPDDDAERVTADVTWDWLWPRLKFSGKWGHADYNYSVSYSQKTATDGATHEYNTVMSTNDRSHLTKLMFDALLPLTRNSGAWLRAITPSASFDWERATGLSYNVSTSEKGKSGVSRYRVSSPDSRYFCATFGLSSHLLRRAAENDVGYRFGLAFSAVYDRAVRYQDYGGMLTLNARLYLPGIGRHHQLMLAASGQSKWPGESVVSRNGYAYRRMVSDRVAAPYGLARVANKQSALLRAAYTLPVCNPDWQWGPVAYVKRLNLRLIGDYGVARVWDGMRTTGELSRWTASAEFWAETRIATLTFPVNVGCRTTYVPDGQSIAATLLLSISFR